MFCFFVAGEFKGFWSNSIGDVFFDLTCTKMQWAKEFTSMVYYPSIQGHELELAVPSLDEVKIYRKETNQTGVDENEQPVLEESQVLVRTIEADKFVINGMMLIPC